MIGSGRVMGHGRELPHAGELLAIEAIDQTGLIVTSEGAFVRIFKVTPPNPLLMSAPEQDKTTAGFQRLVSQLRAEESLQIYIDARPVNLTQLLGDCRREVQASAGAVPERANADPMALAQWRLYAAMEESLRLHADRQAAVQVSCYVVVPFLPRQSVAQGGAGLGSARPAADRRAGAAGAGASPGGTRAAGSPGCAALRARGRGHAHRAARRRAGRASAVGEVQPHQGRQRPPDAPRATSRSWESSTPPPTATSLGRRRCACVSRSRSQASTSGPRTSMSSSTATWSRRSWWPTRPGARTWAGCTERC